MKILLVDDDAFLRDMYATKFTEDDHTVEVAKSGEEAVQKLQEDSYDAVLLDMIMPGLAGTDLLAKLKESPNAENMKVVVLSNQGEKTDIDAAMKAGAVGYIVKAESIPSEVVKKVSDMLNS